MITIVEQSKHNDEHSWINVNWIQYERIISRIINNDLLMIVRLYITESLLEDEK